MNKKFVVSLCVCVMVIGAASLVVAERPKPQEKVAFEGTGNVGAGADVTIKKLDKAIQTEAPKTKVAGAIQYDDGIATAVPSTNSLCYGNQFNTALGSGVNATGNVTQLQFFMGTAAGTDNVFASVLGPVVGATAPVLTSLSIPAPNAGGWNTYTFAAPVTYGGNSFLAGVWYIGGDSIALGSGTTNAQGFHGMAINDVVGTGFTAPGTFNALMRASGDVLVPVELMRFTVE